MRIDSYEFGKIVIEGKKYTNDVIIYPDKVVPNWWRKEGHSLCIEDIKNVLIKKPEIIIVGTGYYGCMTVPEETKNQIKNLNIKLFIKNTSTAIEIFNQCQNKGIVVCLHLTC